MNYKNVKLILWIKDDGLAGCAGCIPASRSSTPATLISTKRQLRDNGWMFTRLCEFRATKESRKSIFYRST